MNPPINTSLSSWQIFVIFLRLGCTSFGGPIAHLGYFREAFVAQRRWLTDRNFTNLVAYCQLMPGPASSQVGILLGFQQRGHFGALAAWLGFTLPSALLMIGLAVGMLAYGAKLPSGMLHGLEIAAVAVVAQAIWGMTRSLYTGGLFGGLTLVSASVTLLFPVAWMQFMVIACAALVGSLTGMVHSTHNETALPLRLGRREGAFLLGLFLVFLTGLPFLSWYSGSQALTIFDAFYRSGSLVFGGGHVVLPLLQAEVVSTGWVSESDFMSGYGAAQAMPGPLFTFAGYLGAVSTSSPSGWIGGLIALIAIFLPAYLLILGGLPFWSQISHHPRAQSALTGVNAAVIGLLLAAFYQPVWQTAIFNTLDLLIAVLAFFGLMFWRLPVLLIVVMCVFAGMLIN